METEKSVEVVNARTGELTVQSERTPEDLLLSARDAAQALERVIKLNERPPMVFNGKRYLEFHHWQVCAKFYHNAVRTFDAQPVEIGGVSGFKARAEVFDENTGIVVGGAEAFCLRDEPNWKTKPTFQLASMAQTRAASKALANKFRFVAIVAGYEGTPQEEMTAETVSMQKQVAMPKEKLILGSSVVEKSIAQDTLAVAHKMQAPLPLASRPFPLGDKVVDAGYKPVTKFFAMLHAKVREKNIPEARMKSLMASYFGKESSKELTENEMVQLIKIVEVLS